MEDPRPAPDDQVAGAADVIGEAAARREVVGVADVPLVQGVSGLPSLARSGERRHDVVSPRGERAPVQVVADAEVQDQVVVDPPGVGGPDGERGPGDVDDPVADVLAEPGDRVVEPAHVPATGVGGALLGKPALQVGRALVEDELAPLEQVPLAAVLPAQELAAELHVVRRLVPVQLETRGEHVLGEQLRKVPRSTERDPREDVVRLTAGLILLWLAEGLVAAADRGIRELVRPLEAVVADLQLGEDLRAPQMTPGREQVR